jgi:hypothetical protein
VKIRCQACGKVVKVTNGRQSRHLWGSRETGSCRDAGRDTLFLFGRELRKRELTKRPPKE